MLLTDLLLVTSCLVETDLLYVTLTSSIGLPVPPCLMAIVYSTLAIAVERRVFG